MPVELPANKNVTPQTYPIEETIPGNPLSYTRDMPGRFDKSILTELREKYGDDYESMAMDIRVNVWQWTPAQIRKRMAGLDRLLERNEKVEEHEKKGAEEAREKRRAERMKRLQKELSVDTSVSIEEVEEREEEEYQSEMQRKREERERKKKNLEFDYVRVNGERRRKKEDRKGRVPKFRW